MSTDQWTRGIDPTRKISQVSEITLRLARIALYQRLQQAESQLKAMGVPNELGSAFLKYSEEVLSKGFKKPELRCIRVDTTPNSVF